MEHLVVLDGLRAEAQRYIEAAQRETGPEAKRKLALAASALTQLVEQLERGAALTAAHIETYREMLVGVLDDELRKAIDTLLGGLDASWVRSSASPLVSSLAACPCLAVADGRRLKCGAWSRRSPQRARPPFQARAPLLARSTRGPLVLSGGEIRLAAYRRSPRLWNTGDREIAPSQGVNSPRNGERRYPRRWRCRLALDDRGSSPCLAENMGARC
jgi:hypothetical protein